MDEPCKCPPPGSPAWMATFADLMSLLMCFFVLLLAFSEMDVLKFKQIAGSMKSAFGVQNLLQVKDIPQGTSVIAQEFRPGRPEPTPIETVMQQTVEITQAELDFLDGESADAGGNQRDEGSLSGGLSNASMSKDDAAEAEQSAIDVNTLASRLAEELLDQIEDGAIEVESLGQQIIIRVKEKGAFPAGSAFLQPRFRPVIRQIGELLKDVPGVITVSGHTDDQPTQSELYRSNWDLSSQRAVSVAHELIQVNGFEQARLKIEGLADTSPLRANNSVENRRANRRVEISIMQGQAKLSHELDLPTEAP